MPEPVWGWTPGRGRCYRERRRFGAPVGRSQGWQIRDPSREQRPALLFAMNLKRRTKTGEERPKRRRTSRRIGGPGSQDRPCPWPGTSGRSVPSAACCCLIGCSGLFDTSSAQREIEYASNTEHGSIPGSRHGSCAVFMPPNRRSHRSRQSRQSRQLRRLRQLPRARLGFFTEWPPPCREPVDNAERALFRPGFAG
jgi:hypothetical protein